MLIALQATLDGVPQGSTYGPIYFGFMMFNTPIFLWTDDTNLD